MSEDAMTISFLKYDFFVKLCFYFLNFRINGYLFLEFEKKERG